MTWTALPESLTGGPPWPPGDLEHVINHEQIHQALNGSIAPPYMTIGDDHDPNESTTSNVRLLVSKNVDDASTIIEQHYVGFTYVSGTSSGVGTLQGASDEVFGFADGVSFDNGLLGYEGISRANGDNGGVIPFAIGAQGSASASGDVAVDTLVSVAASGPTAGSGAVVQTAISMRALEPTGGDNRYAGHLTGRTTLKKGDHTWALEITNPADVPRFASDATKFYGLASDGSTQWLILNPADTPTDGRFISHTAGTGRHLTFQDSGVDVFAVLANGIPRWGASNHQTTVGAAGAASALPGAPAHYCKIDIGGTIYVFPVWLAS